MLLLVRFDCDEGDLRNRLMVFLDAGHGSLPPNEEGGPVGPPSGVNPELPAEAPQPVRANIPRAGHAASVVVGIGVGYGHDRIGANHHAIVAVIASVLPARGAMHAAAAG